MWSYYGSKSKVVDYYPAPIHDKVIEPFAGSARYALKYWEKDVLLVDKYDVIVRLWKWLQLCSEKDILSLPTLKKGETINREDFDCIKQAWLMGFIVQMGVNSPRLTVSKFAEKSIETQKKNIAGNLHKIKHWEIRLGSYWEIPNQNATWFIDPPYQYGGEYYRHSSKQINFYDLSVWCRDRQGQSIVCENTKANWLPFVPMKEMQGSMYRTTEAIWSNLPTSYNTQQLKLIA
jgi:hypothetical protein